MGGSLPDELAADLALVNGKVLTIDAEGSDAEAVATKGNRILMVGTDEEVRRVVGEGTKVYDLKGLTVLPGLIDSHTHPGSYGVFWVRGVQCGPDIGSMGELLARIKGKADAAPEGSWILGYSLDDVRLGRYPSREELDRAAPRNPVYIQRRDGHIGFANSLALSLTGISGETPDPPHGKIDIIPPYTVEEYREGLRHVFEEFISLGLTTIHASMVSAGEFRCLQELRREGSLRLRVCVHASGREEGMLDALVATGIQTPFGDDWLKLTEIEWVYDTSTSGRTAAYYAPYVGEPENTGILLYDQKDITSRVVAAHKAGLRVGLDGIGDRGIDGALDAIEAALEEVPRDDHRHRIEHCCYVTPPILRRLKELGVIDASATGFIHDLGDAYKANRGEESMRWMWPHRTLIDQGIPAPGHSDCPVCSPNPWLGIYGMVTRKTSSGDVLHAEERVTPLEAIKAYTIDGAYAAWEENLKGSIEPGKLADLVVIDRNPLTIPPEELKKIQTVMTIIDGEVAYQR